MLITYTVVRVYLTTCLTR